MIHLRRFHTKEPDTTRCGITIPVEGEQVINDVSDFSKLVLGEAPRDQTGQTGLCQQCMEDAGLAEPVATWVS